MAQELYVRIIPLELSVSAQWNQTTPSQWHLLHNTHCGRKKGIHLLMLCRILKCISLNVFFELFSSLANWRMWVIWHIWVRAKNLFGLLVCNEVIFKNVTILQEYKGLIIHYNDAIMSAMASQITSLTIVYSIVYSGADQRNHQSSVSLTFVRRICRWPVNSPHKGPVTRKIFPFDDVIMSHNNLHGEGLSNIHQTPPYQRPLGVWTYT